MPGWKEPPKRSCAICADLVLEINGAHEPLGRDDAMVFVCNGCSSGRPRAKPLPDRGYEPTGGLLTNAQVKRGAKTAGMRPGKIKPLAMCFPITPGHIMVKVKRADGMDMQSAWKTLEGHPYFRHLRVLGGDVRYFLFEYPDPDARAHADIPSPVEGLESWRVRHRGQKPTQPKRREGGVYADSNERVATRRRNVQGAKR